MPVGSEQKTRVLDPAAGEDDGGGADRKGTPAEGSHGDRADRAKAGVGLDLDRVGVEQDLDVRGRLELGPVGSAEVGRVSELEHDRLELVAVERRHRRPVQPGGGFETVGAEMAHGLGAPVPGGEVTRDRTASR